MNRIIPLMVIFMTIAAACSEGSESSTSAIDNDTTGIGSHSPTLPILTKKRAVYYWKTIFRLDSAEYSFLKRHKIGRVYLRMFDVTEDAFATSAEGRAIPNASVKIDNPEYFLLQDSLKDLEFIPVVYITLDALKAMKGDENLLASNIVTRVRNMCRYNGLPNVQELQLDCDWTSSTEESFFTLCDSVKRNISALKLPWRLSSTIRLHQLARKVPPVDNGVLMVYNTGNFNDPDAANSIIDAKDVAPYLNRLSSYSLHLDIAYPTYSWQLLFRHRHFIGLLNGLELSDTTRFSRRDDNIYIARKDIPYRDRIILTGDMIRSEASDYHDIAAVRAMIEQRMSLIPHSNILYHLDSKNLSRYSCDELDNIL